VGTTAAPGLFFQHRIDRFPHALKNSPSKPPRSGIHILSIQLGRELAVCLAFVQAAMNSGKRLK
jgi:hypothetical protein